MVTNMDGSNIIVLSAEDGTDVRFEFLDLIAYRQKEYVVLLPIDSDDGQVVILELESTEAEQENYIGVENRFVLDSVFSLFKERNKDIVDFE